MSFLQVVLFILIAFAAGGACAFFFLRDRARADLGTGGASTEPLANEVRSIGTQIEHALAEQRLQGETQRQVLSQKLDGVRQTVDTQQTQVQVLQSELRHESQRRDAEIAEIHDRIASIQQGGQLAPPAALALEAHGEPADTPEPEAPQTEALQTEAPQTEALLPEAPAAPPPAESPAPAEPPAAEAPAEPSAQDSLFMDVTLEDVAFDTPGDLEDAAPAPALEAGSNSDGDAPAPDLEDDASAPAVALEDVSPPARDLEDASRPSVFEDAAPFLPTPHGDGSPSEDLFQSWAPTPPSPSAQAVLEDVAPVQAEPAGGSDPLGGSAWIARPSEAAAEEPVVADDLVFTPTPSHEPAFVEPSADEVDDIEAQLESMLPSAPAAKAPALEVAPEPEEPADAPEPFVAPEGADDLTVITSIDEDTQRLLYQAGVTKLDEIAQWGRTSARRYSSVVSVSEETIMTQWIFEAQAALFNRYANTVGQ